MGVGARLRAARERRQLTLGAIATTTKIPRLTLEAIEHEAWTRIPGGIFTRAYVRTFAGEVGLDPDEAVQQFLAEVPEATEDLPFFVEKGAPPRRFRGLLTWGLAAAVVALGAVAAWPPVSRWMAGPGAGGHALMSAPATGVGGAEDGEDTRQALPAAATLVYEPAPDAEAATAPSPVDEADPADRVDERISIVIEPRADCWVSASVDGALQFARLVRAGERQTLEAASVVVMQVGNAGALDYTVNGQPGRALGAEGKVVTARIDLETVHEFIAR